jgi:hypothetical protein
VVAWGDNTYGQTDVPSGLSNVCGVAAGRYNSVVLFADGTVRAWGGGYADQLYPPAGITDVVSISSTWEHTLALREDGTVVAWGRNDYGQATVPPGLDKVVAISAGAFHNLALREDGTVVAWGVQDDRIAIPSNIGPVIDISAGYQHSTYVITSVPVRLPLQRPTLKKWNGLMAFDTLVARAPNTPLKIPISSLALDGNGNLVTVESVGTSSQGAALSFDGTYIYFLPVNNDSDTFTYTVSNGLGTADGRLTISTAPDGGSVKAVSVSVGSAVLRCFGVPGRSYDVQRTTSLSVPVSWSTLTLAPLTPGTDGSFTHTDRSAPDGPAFYRIVQQ